MEIHPGWDEDSFAGAGGAGHDREGYDDTTESTHGSPWLRRTFSVHNIPLSGPVVPGVPEFPCSGDTSPPLASYGSGPYP
jgi:hypothetical protein